MASCCVAGGLCSCLCAPVRCLPQSISTRVMYCGGIVAATILAVILKAKGSAIFRTGTATCDGNCWDYLAVYRISFGMVLYHGFFTLLMINVKTSKDVRGYLQNAFWPVKSLIWLAVIIGPFFMADENFTSYWITAIVFSSLYMILQSVILIDLARSTSANWVEKYETGNAGLWQTVLLGTTFLCYAIMFVSTILLSIYYTGGPGCSFNHLFITLNWMFCLLAFGVSIIPRVMEVNESGGILPAAMLALYNTYLTASAVINNPASCGPFPSSSATNGGSNSGNILMQVLGISFSILAIAYTAFSSSVSDATGDDDDEEDGIKYNYSFFHFIFALTAFYMASVLTNFDSLSRASDTNAFDIGKGIGSMWVTAGTSWINTLLYIWTLLAPLLFPDRQFS